ncbi:MAG: cobalt-precorrin-5B (C(1))-methyltransferase [Coleofasciculaceae cyanobacterium SM2_1_6]|nr:cobalt-precorrin-5B (C(1))-methyltransferase [Coleofasciculaceae cyanobacterium SM2_1_6]
MPENLPRRGYTLPVFACAAAIAAYRWLQKPEPIISVSLDLLTPAEIVEIPIEQVAGLRWRSLPVGVDSPKEKGESHLALAVTKSDPGDNLDLTRNTPLWAVVEVSPGTGEITIEGGEGIGVNPQGDPAIYRYAHRLLQENLRRLIAPGENLWVTIVLPEGRKLAERTSNAAFGVLEGLSLLGTTGISQPLSSPDQLKIFQAELQTKIRHLTPRISDQELEQLPNQQELSTDPISRVGNAHLTPSTLSRKSNQPLTYPLVFCIGENGLALIQSMGIDNRYVVKTANWLGSMLVTAASAGVRSILLFGYHGKLIKLAGGIFHTHHHLADGRLEIFTAIAAKVGLPTAQLQQLYQCPTTDAALGLLRTWDQGTQSDWAELVYAEITQQIDRRAKEYIRIHTEQTVTVGSVLFDRSRQIIFQSPQGTELLSQLKQI